MMYAISSKNHLATKGHRAPELTAGARVWWTHHEAKQHLPAGDDYVVCGVSNYGPTMEPMFNRGPDGTIVLSEDRPIFSTSVMYAITCIQIVPERERCTTLYLNPDEKTVFDNLSVPDQEFPGVEAHLRRLEIVKRVLERAKDYEDGSRFRITTEGWVQSLDEACRLVEKNAGDMHETIHQYVVIEEFHEGLMLDSMAPGARIWYEWIYGVPDWKTGGYKRIDKAPEIFEDQSRSSYMKW